MAILASSLSAWVAGCAGRAEIVCYSATDTRCVQEACTADAFCEALAGMRHQGAHAFCDIADGAESGFCSDGFGGARDSGATRGGAAALALLGWALVALCG